MHGLLHMNDAMVAISSKARIFGDQLARTSSTLKARFSPHELSDLRQF